MTTTVTTTTKTPVKYHGWTLPAGATITFTRVTHDVTNSTTYVSATSESAPYAIAVPAWAVPINVWECGMEVEIMAS